MGCGSSTAAGAAEPKVIVVAQKYVLNVPKVDTTSSAPSPTATSRFPSPSPPSTARPTFSHSSRVVVGDIFGHTAKSYTGGGTSWGAVKAVDAITTSKPVCEMVILAGPSSGADGFLIGVSSVDAPLSALPGASPHSLAWSPVKGHVVLAKSIAASITKIVPQPGDRVTFTLETEETDEERPRTKTRILIELNDGLVARVPLPSASHSDQFVMHIALLGGAAIVLSPPTPLAERKSVRDALYDASVAYRSSARAAQDEADAIRRVAKKAQRQSSAVRLTRLASVDDSDPMIVAARAEAQAVAAEEEERTLMRQVRLKLRALRMMWCPTRQAVSMWRKCLNRAQQRQAAGLQRSPSVKPMASPKPAPRRDSVFLPETVAAIASSFRTVSKTKVLREGVFLDQYVGTLANGLKSYEWKLRNEAHQPLIVEMDFGKCRGLDLHGEVKQKSHVRAYQHKMIAAATQMSKREGFAMSYAIQCTALPPDTADIQAASEHDTLEVESAKQRMAEQRIVVPSSDAPDLWRTLHTQLQAKDTSFIDEAFPPLPASVWTSTKSDLHPLPLAWRRLFAFMPADTAPSFFEPQVDPNDIQQGRLGNCWFCSALSAVAETPELVVRLFGTEQRINKFGVYTVRLCIGGAWREVLLDDYFPCYPGAGPIFTRNHGSQLWVLLVEKAVSKVYGGYDRLVSGQAHHALADLTGYPVTSYQLTHHDVKPLLENGAALLWKELLEDAREDLSMCAGTVGKEDATDSTHALLASVGLVAGHAYTMLNCVEVPATASTSAGTRLIELRNPWASGEWTGDWSDSSPLWTPELVSLMKPHINSSVEDGVFYMELSDFLKYFCTVSTCYIRSPKVRPWREARFSGVFKSTAEREELAHLTAAAPAEMYTMEVYRESDVWCVIYQPDPRLPGATQLIDQGVMIVRRASKSRSLPMEVVCDTKIDVSRQTNETCRLQEGSYFVIPYTTGTRMRTMGLASRDFQLAIFSDESRTVQSLKVKPFSQEVYNDALLSLVREKGKRDLFGKDQHLAMHQLRHGASHLYACGVLVQSSKTFTVTLDCASSKNAQTHRPSSECTRVLAPGSLLLFHHLTPQQTDKATNYNVDIAFKSSHQQK